MELEGSGNPSCLVWSDLVYPSIVRQVKPSFLSDICVRRVAVRPSGD